MIFCFCWIIFFLCCFVVSWCNSGCSVLLFFFTHTVATRVRVLFLVCVLLLFFLMCVCDKCNDFVFHYLLDYSCRVFVSFSCFSRICTIIRSFSKNRWFQSMCGCRKFVRTCSLFSRGDFNSSQSSGFVDFCSPQAVRGDFSCFQFVLLFTAIILFLLRVQDDCQVFLDFLADSLLFPASICCNSRFVFCFTFSALRKSSLNKSF